MERLVGTGERDDQRQAPPGVRLSAEPGLRDSYDLTGHGWAINAPSGPTEIVVELL